MKQQAIPGSLKVDVHRVDDTTKSKCSKIVKSGGGHYDNDDVTT